MFKIKRYSKFGGYHVRSLVQIYVKILFQNAYHGAIWLMQQLKMADLLLFLMISEKEKEIRFVFPLQVYCIYILLKYKSNCKNKSKTEQITKLFRVTMCKVLVKVIYNFSKSHIFGYACIILTQCKVQVMVKEK